MTHDIEEIRSDIKYVRDYVRVELREDMMDIAADERAAVLARFCKTIDTLSPIVIPDHLTMADIALITDPDTAHDYDVRINLRGHRLPYEECIVITPFDTYVIHQTTEYFHSLMFSRQMHGTPLRFIGGAVYDIRVDGNEAPRTMLVGDMVRQYGHKKMSDMVVKGLTIAIKLSIWLSKILMNDHEFDVIEYPSSIQKARLKHHKPPLGDIRIIKPKSTTVVLNPAGHHASPVPHERRGTWCKSKLGKTFWRKESKVLGGRQIPAINIIATER